MRRIMELWWPEDGGNSQREKSVTRAEPRSASGNRPMNSKLMGGALAKSQWEVLFGRGVPPTCADASAAMCSLARLAPPQLGHLASSQGLRGWPGPSVRSSWPTAGKFKNVKETSFFFYYYFFLTHIPQIRFSFFFFKWTIGSLFTRANFVEVFYFILFESCVTCVSIVRPCAPGGRLGLTGEQRMHEKGHFGQSSSQPRSESTGVSRDADGFADSTRRFVD